MKTLEQEWEAFESLVVNVDAGDVQRREMHRCFFSGALAALKELEDTPPANRHARMRTLHTEATDECRRISREDYMLAARHKKGGT